MVIQIIYLRNYFQIEIPKIKYKMKVKFHAGPFQKQVLLLAEHFYIQTVQHNSISISSLKTL